MSRPEGIPDDVWTAACACVSAPDRLGYAKAYTDLIARAILAAKLEERADCAKVATDLADSVQASAGEMRGDVRDYRLHRAAGIRHLVSVLSSPVAYSERLQAIRSRQ